MAASTPRASAAVIVTSAAKAGVLQISSSECALRTALYSAIERPAWRISQTGELRSLLTTGTHKSGIRSSHVALTLAFLRREDEDRREGTASINSWLCSNSAHCVLNPAEQVVDEEWFSVTFLRVSTGCVPGSAACNHLTPGNRMICSHCPT